MEKITFDAGLKSYRINGGAVLKFNPADPNLYARFMEAVERVKQLENTLLQPEADPLEQMCRMDKQVKETLGWVFGGENDFFVGGEVETAVFAAGDENDLLLEAAQTGDGPAGAGCNGIVIEFYAVILID